MTREEAIKIVRNIYQTDAEKEALETLIPELAESEDERIRRRLINLIKELAANKEAIHTGGYFVDGQDKKYIAYLEKQKEQKPAERFEEAREKYQVEWSDEDNIGWDEAFACVTRAEKAAKNEEELQNAVTAEKWLKEIKFKYYVHPVKQEWSEEDEKIIQSLILEVNKYVFFAGIEANKIVNFLKSLRPQYHGDVTMTEAYKMGLEAGKASSWKPCEEQIHAIIEALKYLPNNKDEWMILNTLVDVLRKLM